MATPQPVTHVIFDMDGLLLDTVGIYLECHNRILAPLGHSISWVQLMAQMGHSAIEVCQNLCRDLHLTITPEDYKRRLSLVYPEVFPASPTMPGAERLVRHLHKHNIPIAIASGGAKDSFDLKTTNHRDFVSLFRHVVLASSDPEVTQGKPAPDVFLVCAQRFPDNPDPAKCLVFEDAPNGVQAGVAAGMQVVMVPDPRLSSELTKGATQVLTTLEDFKPESYGLPPFDD
ncbi:pseudouridine-5'-phosphatase-like isoform X2 [Portunus trituberculatus]|uniref:pseudouridine-5'-phosphatase-like isoform X2 n=1 Tax=Portunus trituberculatus TaxID=210409 RepID=UPI001E1CB1CC|nr:pseudouridine-5'-phosphatase-like isoform X2 [Portunus trituberculatus]